MHTPDMTQDNIARIRELFPNCVTEAKDRNGNISLAVDFDALRQELSNSIVEGERERYRLDWPGKKEAMLAANAPIAKTLRPCREESVDFDTTQNLFIEGDNLDALKLLQESYLGKVKMIYIDPPYNTGKDFIYEDDFAENTDEYLERSNQKDERGRLVANTESNGRFHSDWLSMMYPRLKLARNLLSDDGIIFISIDDSEVENLKKLCNEIFGEDHFIGTILWKKKTNGNNMGIIPPVHDYIISYSKNINKISDIGYNVTQEHIEKNYSNNDNDPRGDWTTMDLSANHKGPYFPITNPITGQIFYPPEGRYWIFNEEEVKKRISEKRIIFGKTGKSRPVQKVFASERIQGKIRAESWWDSHGMNENATAEFRELFGQGKLFTHPKPSKLIYHLTKITSVNNDLILDFFAGSSTTAHAVMQLNAEDGGNRRFIMVQLPEKCDEKSEAAKAGYKTIAEISKERIRRAGKKIKEEMAAKQTSASSTGQGSLLDAAKLVASSLDTGFRVLKVDSSNMADVFYNPDAVSQKTLMEAVSSIKYDRSDEDLLFQVLLDWGVDLSLPIRRVKRQGKTVFFVDENALVACFDKNITEELVQELAKLQPVRAVFRDDGFASDAVKINVEQIFCLLSPGTLVKTL